MYIYDSNISEQKNGKFLAVILKVEHDNPNLDTIKEHETKDYNEAAIWVDDEMSRLLTGKGVWE